MSRVERGVRIGSHCELEGAARASLRLKCVLSAHFKITLVNIPIPIVDHLVVVARMRDRAR